MGPDGLVGAGCAVAVLAGGQSRRMGYDKATAIIDHRTGETMLARVIRSLRLIASELLLVGGAPSLAAPEIRHVPDAMPHGGPLAALAAALRAASTAHVLLVGCDMPLIRTELVVDLLVCATASPAEIVGIAAEGRPGRVEPLCALYATTLLSRVEALLASGERRLGAIQRDAHVAALAEEIVARVDPARWSLFNVNTPDDLRRAQDAAMRDDLAPGYGVS